VSGSERNAKAEAGMGCTLDAALLVGNCAFIAHVGDSRVYLARASTLIQLTHDHDLRSVLAAEGRLSPSQRGAFYNQLLSHVGMSSDVAPEFTFVELTKGDRLVLCTDGVHEMLGDEATLAPHVRARGGAGAAAKSLIDAALARGGRDNATALVIEIGDAIMPAHSRKTAPETTRDFRTARSCPLLCDLPDAVVLRALTMAVEVEIDEGKSIPRIVTTDHVAYIVLDGEAALKDLALGAGALLYGESLVGMGRGGARFRATSAMRLLRLRADDFREVCATDPRLAAALYERLARHLACAAR